MDLKLLSSCPVLIGTFYSSYSETAKLLSGAFYVQVPRCPPAFMPCARPCVWPLQLVVL